MEQTKKYYTIGLWIFAIMTAGILAVLYAAQAGFSALLYVCAIVSIISAMCLLIVLLQSKRAIDKLATDVNHLKEAEEARVHKSQQSTEVTQQQTDTFDIDAALVRIMPSAETQFGNIEKYTEKLLQSIAKGMNIVQGLIFALNDSDQKFNICGQYAYYSETPPQSFVIGENLSGQVAKNKELLNLRELPANYVTIISGLGKSAPNNLIIAPIVYDDNSIGIIELASFREFGKNEEALVRKICELTANQLNELRIKI
jgi:transcriptional regulator with GAF, ATPase, and Fis domain